MKPIVLLLLLAVSFLVRAEEVGRVTSPHGHVVTIYGDAGPGACPDGTGSVVYQWPAADAKTPVVGCWYEWLGIVRMSFSDNDSLAIPRSAFKYSGL